MTLPHHGGGIGSAIAVVDSTVSFYEKLEIFPLGALGLNMHAMDSVESLIQIVDK